MLVYDLKTHRAHCLNKTAAFVWNHCDGHKTVLEIARELEQQWREQVSEDVIYMTMEKLGKADLLVGGVYCPQSEAGMTRRRMIRQIGIGTLLLPTVMTIIAPMTVSAATCVLESFCDGTPATNCLPCHSTGSNDCTKRCRPNPNNTPGGQCVGVPAGTCP